LLLIDLPVVDVGCVTRPKIYIKIIGSSTAAAQMTPNVIIKAKVFGQVEQPKQPCSVAPISCLEI
jgi:hypothetical protein